MSIVDGHHIPILKCQIQILCLNQLCEAAAYSNLPEINTEMKFGINSVIEKHSDSAKLKENSYFLTCEPYEFVKKLTKFDPFKANSVTE